MQGKVCWSPGAAQLWCGQRPTLAAGLTFQALACKFGLQVIVCLHNALKGRHLACHGTRVLQSSQRSLRITTRVPSLTIVLLRPKAHCCPQHAGLAMFQTNGSWQAAPLRKKPRILGSRGDRGPISG